MVLEYRIKGSYLSHYHDEARPVPIERAKVVNSEWHSTFQFFSRGSGGGGVELAVTSSIEAEPEEYMPRCRTLKKHVVSLVYEFVNEHYID